MRPMIKVWLPPVALCASVFMQTPFARADSQDCLQSIKRGIDGASIGTHDLQISCRQGDVTLKGTVDTSADRARVVQIAQDTPGVTDVTDWITVNEEPRGMYGAMRQRSDQTIASSVHDALAADTGALHKKITVDVRDGTAVLSGDTKSFREVDQLLATTLMVPGVTDISSQLTVNGRPYPEHRNTRRNE